MKGKKLLIAGLAVAMLGITVFQVNHSEAKEVPTLVQKQQKEISKKELLDLTQKWVNKKFYIMSGGSYQEGEYKTFTHNDMIYRYLSKDIDTKKELMDYLTESVTRPYAKEYFDNLGLIKHKGKLAQLEADGGSILQWDKAIPKFEEIDGKDHIYTLQVPVGETEEMETYTVSVRFGKEKGWRINKLEIKREIDLDVPFNINPAFVFFKYLLVDSDVSKGEFLDAESFDVDSFKSGIKKVEVRTLDESNRSSDQVEFKVTFDVELAKNYKGSLKNGMNELYFLIENTGEFEYKIVSVNTAPQL